MGMPKRTSRARIYPRTIVELHKNFMDHISAPEINRALYPWAQRFVLGYPLPDWQRDFKWTPTQCEKLITSIWNGVGIGAYTLTDAELRDDLSTAEYLPLSNCVMDGQQRLMALEMYFSNQLAVPDEDGRPCLWSEVDQKDSRRFMNTVFDRAVIPLEGEAELRRHYDLMNFSGEPHLESERAVLGSSEIVCETPRG